MRGKYCFYACATAVLSALLAILLLAAVSLFFLPAAARVLRFGRCPLVARSNLVCLPAGRALSFSAQGTRSLGIRNEQNALQSEVVAERSST